MGQMNPLMGALVQTPFAQRVQDAEKSRQLRHAHDARKNAAASDEQEVEESVASPDELSEAGDQAQNRQQRKGTYSKHGAEETDAATGDGGESHLDLTA